MCIPKHAHIEHFNCTSESEIQAGFLSWHQQWVCNCRSAHSFFFDSYHQESHEGKITYKTELQKSPPGKVVSFSWYPQVHNLLWVSDELFMKTYQTGAGLSSSLSTCNTVAMSGRSAGFREMQRWYSCTASAEHSSGTLRHHITLSCPSFFFSLHFRVPIAYTFRYRGHFCRTI